MIDAAQPRVGRDQFVREFGDCFHKNYLTTKKPGNKDFVPLCSFVTGLWQ
jgi:hypothetical protein